MPADLELSPTDKHIFIEEVIDTRLHAPLSISVQALNLPKIFSMQLLLNALNKQVRHFTGSGNTPMTYNLRPVIEEIQRSAEDSGDRRNLKMCLGMLKSMRNRCDQNFVAYRKVCLQQPINSGSFLVSF